MEELNNQEDLIMETLGEKEFLKAILLAMSEQEKIEMFDFIIRMYGMDAEEEEEI